jgi:hypothetical protein
VAVLLVAKAGERGEKPPGRGSRGYEVKVAVVAPARARLGAQRKDRETADEADVDAVCARCVDEVERFVEHRMPPPGRRGVRRAVHALVVPQ